MHSPNVILDALSTFKSTLISQFHTQPLIFLIPVLLLLVAPLCGLNIASVLLILVPYFILTTAFHLDTIAMCIVGVLVLYFLSRGDHH